MSDERDNMRDEEEFTPAGRGGADTGAADLVEIDDATAGEDAGWPDDGEQNDVPGVGSRRARDDE